ncbi:MAG: DUF1249 domain-containing protein [Pseudomonadota bacterium]
MRDRRYSVNLPAHMAECDANYLRIHKLFPAMAEADERTFVLPNGDRSLTLRFEVVERAPYTTLLRLSQQDDDRETPWLPAPELVIRLYHDAKCAEVVEFQNARKFRAVYRYPNPAMRQPDEKAQVNRLLSELLALCLEHGLTATPVLASGDD